MSSVTAHPRRSGSTSAGRRLKWWQQLILQAICLFIAATVLFPILWIVSMSLDPRNISRPTELNLIPPGASLQAYLQVLDRPTANPVTFAELAFNSVRLAGGVSAFSLLVGVSAAYAFSRFKFPGRQFMMIAVLAITVLPSVATIAPLFALLNSIRISSAIMSIVLILAGLMLLGLTIFAVAPAIRLGSAGPGNYFFGAVGLVISLGLIYGGLTPARSDVFVLRNSLLGVGIAMVSGALPFAIWNLKGYLDTIPKELEEAAIIDGASPNQVFFQIVLPLATPALAVTGFLGFAGGWTEFFLSWQFLTDPKDFTLAMSLYNMTGQYAGQIPWSRFAAFSILLSLPVAIVYLLLQRYIVGGLTLGGVKG
ncbi:MAG: ABC transporter permease [Chloroflexus sp.]|uniref:sugar ABC transporter permease n=1 Tax=Chloroflexus sp. TaxID=1904827 RepID=UPI0021DC7093|nr:ABC transporter permease subunit [Chloroflexus sp.]GIV87611.1 MAG: ABC transporter permease [Chloroflexus sp.]